MSKISKALEKARKEREQSRKERKEATVSVDPREATVLDPRDVPSQIPVPASDSDPGEASTDPTNTQGAEPGDEWFQGWKASLSEPQIEPKTTTDTEDERRIMDIGPPPGLLDRRDGCLLHQPLWRSDGDDPVNRPSSAAELLDMRRSHLARHRVMTFLEDHSFIDSYNFLRTQILQRTREQNWNTLMVTSVNQREGKTTTAINLALSLSREALQTALLVDANMRRPCIAEYLGLERETLGLTDYLFKSVDVPDLLINPGLGSMMRVILSGKPFAGSADILSMPRMKHLINELKTRYPDRYVIFDCPHLKHMPDAMVFTSYVDGIILVVEAKRTTKQELMETLEHLKGRNIIGIILNKGERL